MMHNGILTNTAQLYVKAKWKKGNRCIFNFCNLTHKIYYCICCSQERQRPSSLTWLHFWFVHCAIEFLCSGAEALLNRLWCLPWSYQWSMSATETDRSQAASIRSFVHPWESHYISYYCFFPYRVFGMFTHTEDRETVYAWFTFSHWLVYANSAANPIIYNFLSGKFSIVLFFVLFFL